MTEVELRTLAAAQVAAVIIGAGVPITATDTAVKQIADFAAKIAAAVHDATKRSLKP